MIMVPIGEHPKATDKLGIHPMKVNLSIWWDSRYMLLFELLPPNITITAHMYCHWIA